MEGVYLLMTVIYKDYTGCIEYDAENKMYCGEAEINNDIITFQGQTIREMIQAFIQSVKDYEEWLKDEQLTQKT